MKFNYILSFVGLIAAAPLVVQAGVTLSTDGVASSFDLPDAYTLSYSSGSVVSGGLNGTNGIQDTRSYGANIGNGIVSLSLTALAQRDTGAGSNTASASMSFNFTDTLSVQSSGPVTMTLTPNVSISSSSSGGSTGWTSHAKFELNSTASTFTISRNTEDLRTNSSTTFASSPITVTFNPSEEVNQTGKFTLSMLNFYSENAFAQAINPVTGSSINLNLEYSIRITDISAGAIVTSASGTNYTTPVSAVPEPTTFALLTGLAGLGLAAGRRRRG